MIRCFTRRVLFFVASQINAMANAAAGKGFEKESNYSNIKFQFVGIENIHVMRSSLQKLIEGTSSLRTSRVAIIINIILPQFYYL